MAEVWSLCVLFTPASRLFSRAVHHKRRRPEYRSRRVRLTSNVLLTPASRTSLAYTDMSQKGVCTVIQRMQATINYLTVRYCGVLWSVLGQFIVDCRGLVLQTSLGVYCAACSPSRSSWFPSHLLAAATICARNIIRHITAFIELINIQMSRFSEEH